MAPKGKEDYPPDHPVHNKDHHTHSPEHMAMMTEAAQKSPNRRQKGTSRRQYEAAKEELLRHLYPKALLVAEKAIDHYLETGTGDRAALKMAVRVIDQVEGLPTQTVKQDTTVSAIRYETAAFAAIAEAEKERPDLELLPGEVVEEQ
jgi:hypothetical protein